MIKRVSEVEKLKLELLELKRQNLELKAAVLQQQMANLNTEYNNATEALNAYVDRLSDKLGIALKYYRLNNEGIVVNPETNQPVEFPEQNQ